MNLAIHLRYGRTLPNTFDPCVCVCVCVCVRGVFVCVCVHICGASFSPIMLRFVAIGDSTFMRHNGIRDLTAE